MSIHRLQITAGPTPGAAVYADLSTDDVWVLADGFDLGEPGVAFDHAGAPIEGGRSISMAVHIKGTGAAAGIVMQQIARAISTPDRWLLIQREASTDPVWYRLWPQSPGSLDMSRAWVDADGGFWTWALTLTTDSTAVGGRRDLVVDELVPNRGSAMGVVLDTPGEAPTPLRVDVTPSLAVSGRRPMIAAFSVPWDSPLIVDGKPAIIREDSDFASIIGHSTRTTGSSLLSGGTGITVTLDTATTRQMAVTASPGANWRPEPGRYLVLARLYREGPAGQAKVRMGQSWGATTAWQDWRHWRPQSTIVNGSSWLPVGYLQHPAGDAGRGLDPAEIMPPVVRFEVTPTVTHATSVLHLDQVAFVPVELARGTHESSAFAQFQDGIGFGDGTPLRMDGEYERLAILDAFGQHHATPQPLRTGGWPVATPGMATCVVIFLDTSEDPLGTQSVGIDSLVTIAASPRQLHLGQER